MSDSAEFVTMAIRHVFLECLDETKSSLDTR